jgi:hypothetical protein
MQKANFYRYSNQGPQERFRWHERRLRLVLIYLVATLAVIAALRINTKAFGQEPHAESTIAYRLPENKTLHFDDLQKASEHLEAVKKLGCEVTPAGHDGHNDVTYRCPKWKSLTLANDELVHQWEEWFEAAGFETLHGHSEEDHAEHEENHAEENAHSEAEHGPEHEEGHAEEHAHGEEHEEVEFRLANWVNLPPQEGIDSQELIAIVKALGCEVQDSQQAGEPKLTVRCSEWKHLELPSHEAAESWQQWLTKAGFETKHED